MAKTITQTIVFKNTATDTLYSMYLNSKHHEKLTNGGPASISSREGVKFDVWNGYISGKNLQLVKDKLIVQSWRGSDWDDTDADSTFIMHLEQQGSDAVIYMTHANVPDNQVAEIKKGWTSCYWKPWKKYLSEQTK